MRARNMKLIFVVIIIFCIMISGCAASKPLLVLMRESYFNNHPNVPQSTKEAILAKNIVPGMSCGDVTLSWGVPDYKSWIDDGKVQIWSYEATYQPCYSLLFEDKKLTRINKTSKINFVRFEDKVRSRPEDFGGGVIQAETSAMVAGSVDALFDARELRKDKFKIVEEFKKELVRKGIKTIIDVENEKVKFDEDGLDSPERYALYKAIGIVIPGLPENIASFEISVSPLAFLLKGYQAHYAGRCTLKEEDGSLREAEIVLNWRIGGLKKPEVFETAVCSGLRKEGEAYVPVDERYDFKYKEGQEIFVLMRFYDLAPYNYYNGQIEWYSPDGKLSNVGKFRIDTKRFYGHIAWQSVEISSENDALVIGRWHVKIFVNSFLTDVVEFVINP